MYVKLKSDEGKIIKTKIGSCWTCLFLFIFAPLVRGDIKYFIFYACLEGIAIWIAISISDNIGIPLMAGITLFFESNYNEWYIRGKLNNGREPETEEDKKILIEKGVIETEI